MLNNSRLQLWLGLHEKQRSASQQETKDENERRAPHAECSFKTQKIDVLWSGEYAAHTRGRLQGIANNTFRTSIDSYQTSIDS